MAMAAMRKRDMVAVGVGGSAERRLDCAAAARWSRAEAKGKRESAADGSANA